MNQKKLRLTQSIHEMHHLLEKLASSTAPLTLWHHVGDQMILYKAAFLKMEFDQNRLFLQLIDDVASLPDQNFCFVKFLPEQGGAKAKIITLKGKTLILELPDEMVMIEQRRHLRAQFRPEDQKTVSIKVGNQERVFLAINASPLGLAIKADHEDVAFLQSDQQLKILKLNDVELSDMFAGVVTHRTAGSIGVGLKSEIPKQVFDQFSYIKREVVIEPEKLFKDQQFRETVHKNMRIVSRKLENKPKLARAFKALNIDRASTAYIKNHIELLCETTCAIGKKLGWVSEGAIEKLIYVAYMHDIRYFENPLLARVGSLEEFILKKGELSKEEQKIFLEGPSYAAMLAKEDETNSPDVEKILIQQKELPDGNGFPNGVKSAQLAPLSCLFMICHELVDYIYDNQKWTIREFIIATRPSYKGPYFAKIFTALSDLDNNVR